MEKTQKIIVALLILAIVFSSLSVIVSLSVFSAKLPSGVNAPQSGVSGNAAGLGLVVEDSFEEEQR